MTSERYLCSESDRVSCKKVPVLAALIAVRKRLMKAVFFLNEVSGDDATWNKSVGQKINPFPMHETNDQRLSTFLARPGSSVQFAYFA